MKKDVDFVLTQHEFENVLDCSIQDITSRFAGIELTQGGGPRSDDTCTVHTILEGQHRGALLLWADTALLIRVAQKVMGSETVTPRDVEDVATEYFNVICGRVAAGIFQASRVSSRFCSPSFRTGRYLPEEEAPCRCALHYSGGDEGIQIAYVGPFSPENAQTA